MKKALDVAETGLNTIGILIGASDLESILNIVLLIVSIVAILWRAGYAIYTKARDKKYDEIAKELEEAQKALEALKSKEDTKDVND